MSRLWRLVFVPALAPIATAVFIALLFAPSHRRARNDLGGN